MKKLMLLFIGLIPLPLGYIMNYLMMKVYYDRVLPYGAIGIIFLIAWFGLGLTTCHFTDSDKEAVVIVHMLAFVDLLLVIFQEVILKHYWFNQIGIATQLFYLPLVNIAGKFVFFSNRVYWIYVAAFAFMCIVFYLGRLARKNRIKPI